MGRSIIHLIATLFRWQKTLLARFMFTSIGRALTTMAVIFFIREFLAGAVEEGGRDPGDERPRLW